MPVFKLTANDARFDWEGIISVGVNPSSTLAVVGGANGGVRVVGGFDSDLAIFSPDALNIVAFACPRIT
jgi:acid phosphatase family membrane protein YuiD